MNETQKKGLITQLQCQLFFIKKGYNVYLPLSENSRSDLIVDIDNSLFKIQIKTSHINSKQTGIDFNTFSSRMNHSEGNIKIGYEKEQVDFFMTVFDNKYYLIPIEICGKAGKTLSFKQSNNNNATLLEDYEADKVIENLNNDFLYQKNSGKKQIAQYDKTTLTLIEIFDSLGEAAQAIGKDPKTCRGHISEAARGKRKTAYGFVWKIIE